MCTLLNTMVVAWSASCDVGMLRSCSMTGWLVARSHAVDSFLLNEGTRAHACTVLLAMWPPLAGFSISVAGVGFQGALSQQRHVYFPDLGLPCCQAQVSLLEPSFLINARH